jgi:acetoacetyl-CoA synthetase
MANPRPLWLPGEDRIDRANLSRFMRFVRTETGKADLNSYAPLYHFSVEQPGEFWTLLWDFVGIRGSGERTPVLLDEDDMAAARWFPGVSLNFAHNLLRFDDERIAIRCHGADPEHESVSYAQLQRRVAALAAAMRAAGVGSGDRVGALLANEPDALVAMLATASIGAIWFACPTDLAPDRARDLLAPLAPKLLFVSDPARWPTLHGLGALQVVPGTCGSGFSRHGTTTLDDFVAPFADAEAEFASLPFDHPLYLTLADASAAPEYLAHGAGGTLIQHLKELVLHADLKREDKIFFHADNDSMAWYWLASSLVVGATLVLHAGEELAADQPALWDLVDDYGVSVLGVHSRWLDAAARAGLQPRESHRLLGLKTLLVAGAALAPESYDYVFRDIKERVLLVPISTSADTLACFALGAPLLPVYRGEIPCRGLGMKVEVLDGDGASVIDVVGDLVCSAPFPSAPLGFWNDPGNERFIQAYLARHPGHWCSGERATLTARESIILAR